MVLKCETKHPVVRNGIKSKKHELVKGLQIDKSADFENDLKTQIVHLINEQISGCM